MHLLVSLTFLFSILLHDSSVNQLCMKRDMGCTEARSEASRICQLFLVPYIAMKSQSICKDTIGSFLRFLAIKRCAFSKLESQRKCWSSVADYPSVPLLPRTPDGL